MWHLTRLALRSRLVTLGIVVLLAGVSIWAIFSLKQELIPNMEFPYITVITVYPQATPDEVADNVSTPIEQFISDQWQGKSLKHVTSTSADSISIVFAEFEYGTKMGKVTETLNQGVSEMDLPSAVRNASQMVPDLGDNPRVVPINLSNVMPLVTFSLSGDLTADQLKEVADTDIVPALEEVKGVFSVEQSRQILEAARATYVDRFVHSLPDGYDTKIDDEGSSVSAGERQLITIARACPPIFPAAITCS